jgi:hypothetical protein
MGLYIVDYSYQKTGNQTATHFENQEMPSKSQSRYPENWSDIALDVKQSVGGSL